MSKSARNRAQRNVLTKKSPPWGAIAFFSTIAVVVVGAITYAALAGSSSAASISGLVQKEKLTQNHTTSTVKYPDSPPMGGDHDPVWQNCDGQVYTQALRNENAVHSLEHGAVWIAYRPDLPADQIAKLKSKVESTDYTLMSPYPGLSSPIALTAWGRQVKVDTASDKRIDEFLEEYVKGPQTPEPGAACTGGKATP